MANEKSLEELFAKGDYRLIDKDLLITALDALAPLAKLQERYKKDMDSLTNEIRDSLVARYLGFGLVNVNKHGFDCKLSEAKAIFLESKIADINAKSWNATFNDTTMIKAQAFKDNRVFLALSLWSNISKIICIAYGQNTAIGDFLLERVGRFKDGKMVRSTQSISFSKLVFDYGFKILSVTMSREELLAFLALKNKKFQNLSESQILSLQEFKGLD